jgi:hypothetical protein
MKLNLQPETDTLLLRMAQEAHVSKADLAEIAVFNLVALWMKDHEAKGDSQFVVPAHDGADSLG